jgi:hypothetical protein
VFVYHRWMAGTVVAVLERAVDQIVACDVSDMTDAATRAEFLELSRVSDRIDHRKAVLLAAIHRRGIPNGDGAASTPLWAQSHAGQRAGEARALLEAGVACASLPLTDKAWAQGEITASAARTICEGRPEGHEAAYGEVEETLVGFAAARQWRELRTTIAYAHRCADALDGREPDDRNGLQISKVGDRYALSADLDALAGETIDIAIAAATDTPTTDDERTPSKRRADALVTICRYYLDHADLPVEGGEAPHVSVVLDWATITGGLPSPGVVGPSLSPSQISELLCNAKISRIVLGPQHQPIDLGREQREPNQAIRRAVTARDHGCRFPGCGRTPGRCHTHHVTPWTTGGHTNLANLVLLCHYHHRVIHRPHWRATFDGTTLEITKPDGTRLATTTSSTRATARPRAIPASPVDDHVLLGQEQRGTGEVDEAALVFEEGRRRDAAGLAAAGRDQRVEAVEPELGHAVERFRRFAGPGHRDADGVVDRVDLDVATDAERLGVGPHERRVLRPPVRLELCTREIGEAAEAEDDLDHPPSLAAPAPATHALPSRIIGA